MPPRRTAHPLRRAAAALLAWAAVVTAQAADDEAPALVVAYPAGGPVDLVARQLAAALQQQTGRAPRVENLPGASGGIGVARLLGGRSAGWLVGTPSEVVVAPLLNPALGYQPEQLRLAGVASTVAVALVGAPSDDGRPLAALLEAARLGGRPLVCGNYGVGSHAHLAGLALAERTGVPLTHVPHTGVAPLLRELAAGRVDLAFVPLQRGVAEFVAQGRLRLHALAAAARDARWPALPTLEEASGAAGFDERLWVGVFVPAAAGPAALAEAGAALATALRDEAYRAQKLAEGAQPGEPMTTDEAATLLAQETARYRARVQALPR
ncbi:tripartite tricarboxylate transporter substrate-binding protein [Aquincola sp. MAHUQ-54]|uniref:Tripartite tricarboxylate transporter substrate-binding protein n=1 Tax=Aquincola agrisoli TaxID=3119538 RepID=A0AAW9QG51_9BURK